MGPARRILKIKSLDNAGTARDHFQKVYDFKSERDTNILPRIKHRPICSEVDTPPTRQEFLLAAKRVTGWRLKILC
jgi:hypothetical protein